MDSGAGKPFLDSIRLKTIGIILVMVLPIVLLGVVGTLYYQNVMKQSVSSDTLSSAKTISALTPEYVNFSQLYIQSIADRPLVIKAMESKDRPFLHSMAEYANITNRINSIYFVDSRGIVVESSNGSVSNLIGSNVSDRPYVGGVLRTGEPYVGDAGLDLNGVPIVPIGVPIKDNDTMLGVMVGTVDLNEYANVLKNTISTEQYVYLVNRTGHIMVHGNPAYMRNMTDFNSVPAVQDVLSGKVGVGEYYNPIYNQSMIGAYVPINQTGWGVVVAVPQDVAYQPVWNTTWSIVVATIALSLLAVALGLILGNSLVAPIEGLSKATYIAFKTEDYRRSLPLGRKDEIGDLARSFDGMVEMVNRETRAREQAAEALRARSEELGLVLDSVPAGVWIARDPKAIRIDQNRLSAEWLRIPKEANASKSAPAGERPETFKVIKDGAEVPVDQLPVQQAAAGKDVRGYEFTFLYPDGSERHVLGNATPLRDEKGEPRGSVAAFIDITERKRAEEALQESEERRRLAQQVARIGTFEWNIQTGVNTWTHELEAMYGLPKGGFPGTQPAWEQLVYHEDRAEAVRRVDEAIDKGGFEGEWRIVWPDGTVHWLYGKGRVFKDDAGKPLKLLGVNIDITERKIAEEDLKRQATIMNLTPDAIMSLALDGTINFWSLGAESVYGWTKQEAIGQRSHKLLSTKFPEPLEEIDRQLLQTGNWKGELTHRTKDGREVIVQSRWLQYTDNKGESQVLESNIDITERKRAEETREQLLSELKAKTSELEHMNEELAVKTEELAGQSEELECANEELRTHNEELQNITKSLHETQDYLEKLINYANAPIIVWDPKFTITRFNHAFERLSGYMANEIIGKDLSLLFPSGSREESLEKIRRTLEGEQWESVEIPILHKSGGVSIVLWNSANVYGEDNSLLATIAQGQDISKRKQAEKELVEAKSQAELYLDLMGHDISNMHQIMMGQLQLSEEIIKEKGSLGGEYLELIDTSIKTLDRAAKLIENVRKLQKLRSGDYNLESVDLTALLGEVLNEYSEIHEKEMTIKYTPDGARFVRANALLKDVFINLVDNAIKHTSGPLLLAVHVTRVGHDGKSYYRVALEDNGKGIPDQKKEEIFDRFKRGDTKARGTGLGLYIVKTLVEGFGGYVEVQNRILEDYTKGTRFMIYLPVMEENDA